MRKYEVSHICAAVVATVAIVVIGAIALDGLVSFEVGKLTEWISALVSVCALITSGAALIYLRKTFGETKRQADTAVIAMEQQARSSAQDVRPWVSFTSEGLEACRNTGEYLILSVEIENVGKSPAASLVLEGEIVGEVHFLSMEERVRQFLKGGSPIDCLPHSMSALFPNQRKSISCNVGSWSLRARPRYLLVRLTYQFDHISSKYQYCCGFALRFEEGGPKIIRESIVYEL